VGRRQALLVIIVRAAPSDEVIWRGVLNHCRQRVDPAQDQPVAGIDDGVDTAADKARAAFEHRNPRRPIRPAAVDVVDAGLQQPQAAARDVDFRRLIRLQAAQVQIDTPLRQCDLHDLVAQLGEIELRIVRQIDRIRADAHLGTGLRVGHQPGAGRDRRIDLG